MKKTEAALPKTSDFSCLNSHNLWHTLIRAARPSNWSKRAVRRWQSLAVLKYHAAAHRVDNADRASGSKWRARTQEDAPRPPETSTATVLPLSRQARSCIEQHREASDCSSQAAAHVFAELRRCALITNAAPPPSCQLRFWRKHVGCAVHS